MSETDNEKFIALLKSAANENRLEIIPNEDLLEICKRARSIAASSKKLDTELSWTINKLLDQIKKRRLSQENKPLDISHYMNIDKKYETVSKMVKQSPKLSIDVIFNNPFRILGLPVNVTEKEIVKQAEHLLKQCATMGKISKVKFAVPCFPVCERSSEIIEEAKKKIDRLENRFLYSFFWYSNGGSVNQLILDVLSEGKTEKAIELWEKKLSKYMVALDNIEIRTLPTDEDFSCAKNLMVLYLGLAFKENELNVQYFRKALYLSGRVFHSRDALSQYAALIGEAHYRHDNSESIGKSFIDEILNCIKPLLDNNISGETLNGIAKSFDLFPDILRKEAIKKLANKPIQNIKDKVAETAEKRKKNPLEANKYGIELYKNTYNMLPTLKDILLTNILQYQNISNAVADEIESCFIDYFTLNKETENNIDPGDDALKLAKYAASIAIDITIKDRIKTWMPILEKWVQNRTVRERRKKADPHIGYIVKQLNDLPDPDKVLPNELIIADRFLKNCTISLNSLKSILVSDINPIPSTIIIEQFEDNENKWTENEDVNFIKKIEDGKYVLENKNEKNAYWAWGVNHLNFSKYCNFTFECSMTKIKGADIGGYGIVWSYQKKDEDVRYFLFCVSGNGQIYLSEYNRGGWVGGFQWTASEHVVPGDKTNILTVRKIGDSVLFFINNNLIVIGDRMPAENMIGTGIGFWVESNIKIGVNYLYFCNANISDFSIILDYNYYLSLSSAVANRALAFSIAYANRTRDMEKPIMLMNKIQQIDMVPELRKRFDENEGILKSNLRIKEENTPPLVKLFKKVSKWL